MARTVCLHVIVGADVPLDQDREAMERSANRYDERVRFSRTVDDENWPYPLEAPFCRSSSSCCAMARASRFSSTTARTVELTSAVRLMYAWDIRQELAVRSENGTSYMNKVNAGETATLETILQLIGSGSEQVRIGACRS